MTGSEHDDQHDDQHHEIRRLLADARHTEPMPAEIVARMDAVLADLAATKGADAAGPSRAPVDRPAATVVSLSAHRRRRAGGLLVAAAAIVVAGIAITQHLPHRSDTTAATSATPDRAPAAANGEAAQPSATPQHDLSGSSPGTLKVKKGRVVVRASTFPADATAARQLTKSSYAAESHPNPEPAQPACVAAPTGSDTVAATFQHARAALVFLRPEGDTQVVDLYLCGQSKPIRSVTLPAP